MTLAEAVEFADKNGIDLNRLAWRIAFAAGIATKAGGTNEEQQKTIDAVLDALDKAFVEGIREAADVLGKIAVKVKDQRNSSALVAILQARVTELADRNAQA